MSVRDITLGETFDMKFTTRAFATGIPTTMAGSPTVTAYSGNSTTTEITAGITLTYTSGFDGIAGLANVRVAATGGNGYAADTDYALILTGTPTVGGVSVLGEVIGHFSTSRSAAAVAVATAQTDLNTLTDAAGEPGTGAPAVSLSLVDKVSWIYKLLRNKKDATATLIRVYDDAGSTVHHKRTISDDGTTYTEEEIVAGP